MIMLENRKIVANSENLPLRLSLHCLIILIIAIIIL
jgi:hypothetical protein